MCIIDVVFMYICWCCEQLGTTSGLLGRACAFAALGSIYIMIMPSGTYHFGLLHLVELRLSRQGGLNCSSSLRSSIELSHLPEACLFQLLR